MIVVFQERLVDRFHPRTFIYINYVDIVLSLIINTRHFKTPRTVALDLPYPLHVSPRSFTPV